MRFLRFWDTSTQNPLSPIRFDAEKADMLEQISQLQTAVEELTGGLDSATSDLNKTRSALTNLEHEQEMTSGSLARESDKAKGLRVENESYGNTLKDIINIVSRAQVCWREPSLFDVPNDSLIIIPIEGK